MCQELAKVVDKFVQSALFYSKSSYQIGDGLAVFSAHARSSSGSNVRFGAADIKSPSQMKTVDTILYSVCLYCALVPQQVKDVG